MATKYHQKTVSDIISGSNDQRESSMMEVILYGMRIYSRMTIKPVNIMYLDYLNVSIEKGYNKLGNEKNGWNCHNFSFIPNPQ